MYDHDESRRVAEQIHSQWPYIEVAEAQKFYESLGHISAAEGTVRVGLWVLAKVLQHQQANPHA